MTKLLDDPHVGKAIRERNVRFLCKYFFGVDLTFGQEEIVRTIAFQEHKRVVIVAMTRWGKSFSVSLGVLLYILFNEDKKINLIAPILDQTAILRGYIADYMFTCPLFQDLLPKNMSQLERLQTELSKKRVHYTNGCRLRVFSAEGEGRRMMGWGAELLLIDEGCDIKHEVYRKKISRMLGDNPDSMLVEIGNPLHRLNQMWEHWNDPAFKKIHISWEQGVREGRITQDFIDEQRRTLTPIEFTILYDALFPEDTEDTLIRYEWIQRALENDFQYKEGDPGVSAAYGLDVAEWGVDQTVLAKFLLKGAQRKLAGLWWWSKKDTMPTVGEAREHIRFPDGREDHANPVFVDATGVGSGVYSRLKELGYNAVAVKGGEKPTIEPEKYRNLVAQNYWMLRKLFEDDLIDIFDVGRLAAELNTIRYKIVDSNMKIGIIKPTKSPDFADACQVTCLPKQPGAGAFSAAVVSGEEFRVRRPDGGLPQSPGRLDDSSSSILSF